MGARQLYGAMTSRNSLKNPLNKGLGFMKAFTSLVLHVLGHLPFASYPTLNWQFRMSLGGFWNRQGKSNSCLLELLTVAWGTLKSCIPLRGHLKRTSRALSSALQAASPWVWWLEWILRKVLGEGDLSPPHLTPALTPSPKSLSFLHHILRSLLGSGFIFITSFKN